MHGIFLQIFNMSISASYIVLAVLALRLALRRAPKWVAVLLWGIVAVRLVCPFSFESALSLIPSAEVVSPDIMTDAVPEINTGIFAVNSAVNPIIGTAMAPAAGDSVNPMQILVPILTAVWLLGTVSMLCFMLISYARVKRRVGTAVLLRDNVYQSEYVSSPFVLGLVRPKIYLPFNINEQNSAHVIAHEKAHIKRCDHLWKPLGFLLLSIYWFNPLLWLAYILLCRDIELACDERVIKALDRDARADYSEALLNYSVNRRMISACPLAFGEVGIKARVRSVLNYKKPALWLIIAAVLICVAVSVCFLTNPPSNPPADPEGEFDPAALTEEQRALYESFPEYFGIDASAGLDVYVWQLAENHYAFGLLPHTEDGRFWLSEELLSLKGVGLKNMQIILSSYDIDEDKINVIPWQNPISSYIPNFRFVEAGEGAEAQLEAQTREYVEHVRRMLFGY